VFKALGLVNTCGDESPPVPEPEPEPIDANIRIDAAQKVAEESALEHLKAHQEADALSKDRTRSNNRSVAVATKVVESGVKAHDDASAKDIAKSKAFRQERVSQLISPNKAHYAYVDCNNIDNPKIVIKNRPNTNTNVCKDFYIYVTSNGRYVYILDQSRNAAYYQIKLDNVTGIQLTDEGKIVPYK